MALFDKTPTDPPRASLTGRLVEDVTDYIDTRVNLARLDVQHSVRNALVGTIHGAALAVLAFFTLIFLSIFAGLALNAVLGSPFWGFGIVTGIYLLLTLLFVFGVDKDAFTAMVEKMLHNKIYKSEIDQERPASKQPTA